MSFKKSYHEIKIQNGKYILESCSGPLGIRFQKAGRKTHFPLLENVVIYSSFNICEMKTQIDCCPGEAQPFLVGRQGRNDSQFRCEEDVALLSLACLQQMWQQVSEPFYTTSLHIVWWHCSKGWSSNGNFQRTLECGSGIWLSLCLGRWRKCRGTGCPMANLPQYPSVEGAVENTSKHIGTPCNISVSVLPAEFTPILCYYYERTQHITGSMAMPSSGIWSNI